MGFHDTSMESISGELTDFSQFEGDYTLCVNVATF
ncbi:MAG: glutathione peroxidase-family protein [Verrucomicrobiales bacterium]|jgi:glutathione peroxidase-family protein